MEIIQVVGLGLLAAVLALIVKEQKPVFAFLLAAFTGIVIFLFLLGKMASVLEVLEDLAIHAKVDPVFLKTVLKIIGIAYIAEFGAQIVRDAGQDAIAGKIELAGKILIMVMAIPIIKVVVETVINLMPA
ncbi:MAG: stage III sporulation protein AD [Paenibacillaceae bacterium]|uniref:stage III sporulation protein AD n=1 Tax=Paenibacillus cymbidii TaxID=1639034 RepID=UPI001081D201|nr:stage III sporulation protein AD [Paenibacillus cymbidii]MBO9605629.1 stage III sporulation protein AD [Paenibacillaceae bacterium]